MHRLKVLTRTGLRLISNACHIKRMKNTTSNTNLTSLNMNTLLENLSKNKGDCHPEDGQR